MKHAFVILITLLTVYACKKDTPLETNIAKININVDIERFDLLFSEVNAESLPKLKQRYPFMFSEMYENGFWIEKASDSLQKELHQEVEKTFSNFNPIELEIESLFNHLKYYYPEFRTPRIITTTSDVDYRNHIIVTDTIVVLALDNYLGNTHEFYQNIPKYIRENFKKEQIVVDLAGEYAKKYSFEPVKKTFLDDMIFFGKQLYFKEIMIPFKSEFERIGYTKKQLDWAKANESYIWGYFIENELLFSTDQNLASRFLATAPFSKFYLEDVDAESPGSIGQYMGWQIVRAYMKQNDVTIQDMLTKSAEEIFNKSKFKPRK